jgi:two-component system nitrate/nitrite response regulator NarL
MTAPVRIFVVDDHALFREGLLRLLEGDPAFTVVGSAASATAALPLLLLEGAKIDVLLLDYDLGAETALPLVRTLHERKFTGRVLIVTAGLPNHDALVLLRLGIAGIFHKHQPPSELHHSIRSIAEGQVLIEQQYLQRLLDTAQVPREPACSFTERERNLLRLLLEGMSNKEIAAQLGSSESAIKSMLQALFAKTGVRTRTQLVRIVLEQLRDAL